MRITRIYTLQTGLRDMEAIIMYLAQARSIRQQIQKPLLHGNAAARYYPGLVVDNTMEFVLIGIVLVLKVVSVMIKILTLGILHKKLKKV